MAILDSIKSQMQKLKAEYKTKRSEIVNQIRALEKSLEKLDADYGAVISLPSRHGARARARRSNPLAYGGVRTAVLDAIKAGKGLKPKQIAEKTGLDSPQVHNSLTGLKKSGEVRVKDGLYFAA